MPKLDSNRIRHKDGEPRRGKRTISKALVRRRRTILHTLLAKAGAR